MVLRERLSFIFILTTVTNVNFRLQRVKAKLEECIRNRFLESLGFQNTEVIKEIRIERLTINHKPYNFCISTYNKH